MAVQPMGRSSEASSWEHRPPDTASSSGGVRAGSLDTQGGAEEVGPGPGLHGGHMSP